jgi:hypothetical protein
MYKNVQSIFFLVCFVFGLAVAWLAGFAGFAQIALMCPCTLSEWGWPAASLSVMLAGLLIAGLTGEVAHMAGTHPFAILGRIPAWLDDLAKRTRLEIACYSDGTDWQLVYKVVSRQVRGDGVTIQRWSWGLPAHSTYAVQYLPGEFVGNGTPLLVFDGLEHAQKFVEENHGAYLEIWVAIGERPRALPYDGCLMKDLPSTANKGLLPLFWQSELWHNLSKQYRRSFTLFTPTAVFHPTRKDRYGYFIEVSQIFPAPDGTLAFERVKLLEQATGT